jgi:Retrotransposon gag protein
MNNKHHWTTFKTTFNTTFASLGEKVKAENTIHTLKIKCGDLDTYIATFKKLLALFRYKESEYSSLQMFKKGLPAALNITIIQNMDPVPTTLKEWIH